MGLSEEQKEKIKSRLIELIQSPEDIILATNSYEQLTLVACLFVKYDFPAKWLQLNQWLLMMFEQLYLSLNTMQME
jgi:hypothetical protein